MSKVISQLKQLQADSHAFYVKLHNYHWNVTGMDFTPIHLKTEEIYTNMATLYDDTAERIIQLGDKPYLTMGEIAKATKIKEEKRDTFKSKEVLKNVISDFEYLLKSFTKLSNEADKADDKATAAFADDNIAILEKEIWMLSSMLK